MFLRLCVCVCVQDEKMNVEALSRAELLTLLSILEGELEAQDVVIHALRVSPGTHNPVALGKVTHNREFFFCTHLAWRKYCV